MQEKRCMQQPFQTEALASLETGAPPLVQVEHLSRVMGTGTRKTIILDDLTFSVPHSSLFAITGPSGSGKSTLLNMLTGVDHPTSGQVLFANQALAGKSEDELARWRGKHVGIVFQFFQLLPTLTAFENVLLALELGRGGGLKRRDFRARAMLCLEMARVQA